MKAGLPMRADAAPKGEEHVGHVLTEKEVLEIREALRGSPVSMRGLADHYGVSSKTISNIRHGFAWAHLLKDGEDKVIPLKGLRPLSEEKMAELEAAVQVPGVSLRGLARLFGVSQGCIHAAVRRVRKASRAGGDGS